LERVPLTRVRGVGGLFEEVFGSVWLTDFFFSCADASAVRNAVASPSGPGRTRRDRPV